MRAAIGLGSNLGRPEANLLRAVRALEHVPGLEPVALSSGHWTEPVGPAQPRFLNAALLLETRRSAGEVLAALLGVEAALGRRRGGAGPRFGPRPIDLDLLLFGDEVVDEGWLVVPHPRLRERAFALVPLLELWPDARDPATGEGLAEALGRVGGAGVGPPIALPAEVGRTDLEHTADLAFGVSGPTVAETLERAALALVDLVADRARVTERERRVVEAAGADRVDLLVALLGEIVFLLDARRFVPRRVSLLSLAPGRAELAVYGEELRDPAQVRAHVKAVTYHGATLNRDRRRGLWSATVVVDI